jgi:ssDNA-binding Zn-finger/Zn-ribbon topoisomerase 1
VSIKSSKWGRFKRIMELSDKASSGAWSVGRWQAGVRTGPTIDCNNMPVCRFERELADKQNKADAEFVAALVNFVRKHGRKMLADLEAEREEDAPE